MQLFLSFWDSGNGVSPVSTSNQMKWTHVSNVSVLWLIFVYEMNAVLASKLKTLSNTTTVYLKKINVLCVLALMGHY